MNSFYDAAIIGAGVVGCAVARELSRYDIRIAVIEKEFDVASGASSRNSGVIHSGIHYSPGSLRAVLNVRGNELMRPLCDELGVRYSSIGKITVAQNTGELTALEKLKEQGDANGVPGLECVGPDLMQKLQPGIKGIRALYSPSTGIISPYGLTIALAENAHANGACFFFGHRVTAIRKENGFFTLQTDAGNSLTAKTVINCAGVHAAEVASMAGIHGYRIYPCRGEYYVLDRRLERDLSILVYPAPHAHGAGLGVHLTKTVDGNILIGPSNEYVSDGEDYSSTRDIMDKLRSEGRELLPSISLSDFIRSFSGIRAKQTSPAAGGFADFVIEDRADLPGFIILVGIESPGLTSSPAIAEKVVSLVSRHLDLKKKDSFAVIKKNNMFFHERTAEEKRDLAAADPLYGEIVCRCEAITKRELVEAIENPLGIRTVAGLKYRSRAMMGRCQGGFCLPKIIRILEQDFGYRSEDYLYKGNTSRMIDSKLRNR
jgi:glycerol-3-phosphate dehydrogenase